MSRSCQDTVAGSARWVNVLRCEKGKIGQNNERKAGTADNEDDGLQISAARPDSQSDVRAHQAPGDGSVHNHHFAAHMAFQHQLVRLVQRFHAQTVQRFTE